MEKKNQKLFIIVGVLLLSVGVSLAYFTSKALNSGEGATTNVTTASINGAKLNIEGVLEFTDVDILPGHKSISGVKITATGNNELIPYNLIWQGTNTLTTPLNFTIYKTSEKIDVTSTCNKKTQIISGAQALSEECNISNIDKLGTEIASGVINKEDAKITLVKDEFITAYSTGNIIYYYIILEYPNLDEPQNNDIGGTIEGKITVEKSDKKPDINILAAYVIQEDGTYKETEDVPQSGYQLNSEKSTCSNGAIPRWNTGKHRFYTDNLTKIGTSCYLYFDKFIPAGEKIIANINKDYIKEGSPDFTKTATGAETVADNGIYKMADPMYGENAETYYWRGAATSNHIIFAGICWRIIRINGDGTIRLIYNGDILEGNTCTGNSSNDESIAVASKAYNSNYNNSAYVGYTHTENIQRPTTTMGGNPSNLKIQTETWYKNNIGNNETYAEKVTEGKYCNDRNTKNNEEWRYAGTTQYYAAYVRLVDAKKPTLSCSIKDVYEVKAGAITADEVSMAGGVYNINNNSYYLYIGKNYWTMSPYCLNSNVVANVFYVSNKGIFNGNNVNITYGIRPAINLRSDVTFEDGGEGTSSKPFIVAN